MSRVISVFKGVRNHWKKSAFAAGVVGYGVLYAVDKYKIHQLMRKYCTEATAYGNVTISVHAKPTNVLVILNPTANKRSAQKTYDEYCAPILHLAGLCVEIVQTDSEGHARRYIEELEKLPDAIIVAGGDGTVSEAITGLLRRNKNEDCPVGVLPVGRTNTLAQNLFNFTAASNLKEVESLADATIAVVRGQTDRKDVIKIEPILSESTDADNTFKPIFAMGTVQWGAFRDALTLRDKYWYTGPLRAYTAFLFNAFSDNLTWNCSGRLTYSPPCKGCSNCFVKISEPQRNAGSRRWWGGGLASNKTNALVGGPDYSKVVNVNCRTTKDIEAQPSEMLLSTNVNRKSDETPALKVQFGKDDVNATDFILESWKRLRTDEFIPDSVIDVRALEFQPEQVYNEDNEAFFSIDNEAYEVKPVRISVVPRAIRLFV